jgi:hypothetical protein
MINGALLEYLLDPPWLDIDRGASDSLLIAALDRTAGAQRSYPG